MPKPEIREGDIKVLKTTRVNDNFGKILRIANYITNGKPTKKKFERRGCYQRDGEWFVGKLQGLDADDLKFILDNYEEIEVSLLENSSVTP